MKDHAIYLVVMPAKPYGYIPVCWAPTMADAEGIRRKLMSVEEDRLERLGKNSKWGRHYEAQQYEVISVTDNPFPSPPE